MNGDHINGKNRVDDENRHDTKNHVTIVQDATVYLLLSLAITDSVGV